MDRKLVSHLVVLAVGMAMGLGAVAVAQSQTALRPVTGGPRDGAAVEADQRQARL
jgi:hypothetical protein